VALRRKVRRFVAVRFMGLRVRIPLGALNFFFCECYVLSGLCLGLITRPEEPKPRVVCPTKCDREAPCGETMTRKGVEGSQEYKFKTQNDIISTGILKGRVIVCYIEKTTRN